MCVAIRIFATQFINLYFDIFAQIDIFGEWSNCQMLHSFQIFNFIKTYNITKFYLEIKQKFNYK